MDTDTPTDMASPMARWGIAPLVTSSTCRLSTWTAGSAATMNQPTTMPMGTNSQYSGSPARVRPRKEPAGIKPTLAPVRNRTNPMYV